MMKLILLNGPKGVGKDAAAAQFIKRHHVVAHLSSIMLPSKIAALAEIGVSANAVDYYETCKDTPRIDLGGRTPRQVYIDFAERERAKNPNAIVDCWTATFVNYNEGEVYHVVPDCRFPQELIAAVELVGVENVCLVSIFRKHHDWIGDIGQYMGYDRKIGDGPLEHLDFNLYNDGPLDRLGPALAEIVEQWEAGATFVEKHTGA